MAFSRYTSNFYFGNLCSVHRPDDAKNAAAAAGYQYVSKVEWAVRNPEDDEEPTPEKNWSHCQDRPFATYEIDQNRRDYHSEYRTGGQRRGDEVSIEGSVYAVVLEE